MGMDIAPALLHDPWLTTAEIADLIGATTKQVQNLHDRGLLLAHQEPEQLRPGYKTRVYSLAHAVEAAVMLHAQGAGSTILLGRNLARAALMRAEQILEAGEPWRDAAHPKLFAYRVIDGAEAAKARIVGTFVGRGEAVGDLDDGLRPGAPFEYRVAALDELIARVFERFCDLLAGFGFEAGAEPDHPRVRKLIERRDANLNPLRGCYSDGSPRDPAHPWFKGPPPGEEEPETA
jgi:hypothetical protein